MSAHKGRVARSLVWTSLESLGVSGISLISIVVYARFLTPTELGIAAMALSLVQLVNIPVELLFHDALVQRKEATERHFDTAFSVSVLLSLILMAICVLGAEWFASVLGVPEMAPVLQWMSVSLPFMGFASALIARQRRAMEFRPLAVRSVIGRSVGGVSGIALAIGGAGMWSLVAQQVLTVAFSTIFLWGLVRQPMRFRIHWKDCAELANFGLYTTFFTFLAVSTQRIFILMVGALLGSHIAGYFDLAFRIVNTSRDLFFGAVSQLSLPIFARLQDSRQALASAYTSAVQFTSALMFPLFVGLALCSAELVTLVFGARWHEAIPIVATLAVLTVHFFARMYSAPMMNAAGMPAYPIYGLAVQVVFVVVAMLLIGRESYFWATAIWVARVFVSTPVEMFMLKRATGLSLREQVRGLPLLLLCTLGMAFAVLAVKFELAAHWPTLARFALMCVVGALTYPALLWLADRHLVQRIFAFIGTARLKHAT